MGEVTAKFFCFEIYWPLVCIIHCIIHSWWINLCPESVKVQFIKPDIFPGLVNLDFFQGSKLKLFYQAQLDFQVKNLVLNWHFFQVCVTRFILDKISRFHLKILLLNIQRNTQEIEIKKSLYEGRARQGRNMEVSLDGERTLFNFLYIRN